MSDFSTSSAASASSRPKVAEVLVGVAETVGRLKPNGTLVRRSPLSDLMELEALSAAVEAKRLG